MRPLSLLPNPLSTGLTPGSVGPNHNASAALELDTPDLVISFQKPGDCYVSTGDESVGGGGISASRQGRLDAFEALMKDSRRAIKKGISDFQEAILSYFEAHDSKFNSSLYNDFMVLLENVMSANQESDIPVNTDMLFARAFHHFVGYSALKDDIEMIVHAPFMQVLAIEYVLNEIDLMALSWLRLMSADPAFDKLLSDFSTIKDQLRLESPLERNRYAEDDGIFVRFTVSVLNDDEIYFISWLATEIKSDHGFSLEEIKSAVAGLENELKGGQSHRPAKGRRKKVCLAKLELYKQLLTFRTLPSA